MAEETLKRLLDAEAKAEEVIAHADEERRKIIEEAEAEIRASEQRHAEHVREIRANFTAQAETRAQQTLTELKRRHAERAAAMRTAAASMEAQALDAAIALLTGAGGAP